MKLKLERGLGEIEKIFFREKVSVLIIGETVNHNFDMKILKKALDATVDLQPNLRINIDKSSEPLNFIEVDNPYIEPVLIESENPDEWKVLADRLGNEKLEPSLNESVFKFTLLKIKNDPNLSHYFFVQMSHGNSDGTSGMIVMNNILTYYTLFSGGEAREFTPVEFLPSVENFAKENGLEEKDEHLIEVLLNERLNPTDTKAQINLLKPCNLVEDGKQSFLFQDGTEENFIKMRSFCKREGLTVGSLLMAAYYFTAVKLGYDQLIDKDSFNIPIFFDINLRDRTKIKLNKNHIACFISINEMEIQFNKNTSFLQLCKKVKETLNSCFETNHFLHQVEVERRLSKITCNAKNIAPSFLSKELNFSNIGAYPFNPIYKIKESDIKLKSLKSCGNPWSPFCSHYVFLIFSINYMSYSMVYSDENNNKLFAETLMNMMIDLVENCETKSSVTFEEFLTLNN